MRNLGLDVLRFVAVLLVLGRHLDISFTKNWFLQLWHRGGWIGVDIFFVLSGFLISSLLFKEYIETGAINVKRFLIRRGFKIYPAFWMLIGVSVPILYLDQKTPSVKHILAELFFVQNYLEGIWNHTWSLAVEEHFYIGMALLFAFLTSRNLENAFRPIPVVFWIVASCCLSLRLLNLLMFPDYSHQTYLFGTHLRIDSLFFGVWLSYHYHFSDLDQKIRQVPTWLLLSCGSLFLCPAFFYTLQDHKWISVLGVILLYLGSGMFLLAALRLKQSSRYILRAVGILGATSYSIYLWHIPIETWGYRLVNGLLKADSFLLYFLTYLLGSCIFGFVMNRIIEYPMLYIRDVLFPQVGSVDSVRRVGLRQS
jgi:peptidoglycan/LPS O-acetylase OafA/YrhL